MKLEHWLGPKLAIELVYQYGEHELVYEYGEHVLVYEYAVHELVLVDV